MPRFAILCSAWSFALGAKLRATMVVRSRHSGPTVVVEDFETVTLS